jgi:glycosyltransferase involved in cell wall biosynthesis
MRLSLCLSELNFVIVFAESISCGTPVISCPTVSLPEIVRPGIDGYLVNNIEEAIAAVGQLPKIDRANCRQRVEDLFSAEVVVDRCEQLYQTLIK